jgi:hypothetical protein
LELFLYYYDRTGDTPRASLAEGIRHKASSMKNFNAVKMVFAAGLILAPVSLLGQNIQDAARGTDSVSYDHLYMKMQLDGEARISALRPGDVLKGKLVRDVYSGDNQLFSAGSPLLLTVNRLEQRRREPNDHWPWVIKAFTPRHEKYPIFQSAKVKVGGDREVPLQVAFLTIRREVEVSPPAKMKGRGGQTESAAVEDPDLVELLTSLGAIFKKSHRPSPQELTADFEADVQSAERWAHDQNPRFDLPARLDQSMTIAAGTQAKLILLNSVSASKNHIGDAVQARLIEPIIYNSMVALPEGTVLEGTIVKRTPPRMLSRAGSLLLSFNSLTYKNEEKLPIEASVAGVQLDHRSHTKIDAEGVLQGDHPGIQWMALNLAVTAGVAKVTDDALQLAIELVVSTATDVSTAGTARIAGACASGIYLLTRHGRDVVLPKFTEMQVTFDRPLTLQGTPIVN